MTGGAGYIGSHVCKKLSQGGYLPVTFDNLSRGFRELVKWGPLEIGDVTCQSQLVEVIQRYSPVAIMHFAAYAYVGESVERPGMYFENNIGGGIALLRAMQVMQDPLLVFSSSCATYGVPDRVPIDESHRQEPINPYGLSKLVVEKMIQTYSDSGKVRGVCLRYFNAAGADPDAEIGELHDPETHLVPLAIYSASGSGDKLSIFGWDYDTPDGTCIRDFVHVADLADAHVLALEHLLNGGGSRNYNLSNGTGFSVKQVINAVQKVAGRPVRFELGQRRAGDPPILIGDSLAIRDELGWAPKFTELDDIVRTAWTFLSSDTKKTNDTA